MTHAMHLPYNKEDYRQLIWLSDPLAGYCVTRDAILELCDGEQQLSKFSVSELCSYEHNAKHKSSTAASNRLLTPLLIH